MNLQHHLLHLEGGHHTLILLKCPSPSQATQEMQKFGTFQRKHLTPQHQRRAVSRCLFGRKKHNICQHHPTTGAFAGGFSIAKGFQKAPLVGGSRYLLWYFSSIGNRFTGGYSQVVICTPLKTVVLSLIKYLQASVSVFSFSKPVKHLFGQHLLESNEAQVILSAMKPVKQCFFFVFLGDCLINLVSFGDQNTCVCSQSCAGSKLPTEHPKHKGSKRPKD